MHGATLAQIEQVIEAQQPAIVIADMLGNFHLARDADTVNIPPSWNLNEKQRNFIESMFDEKVK